MHVLDEIQHLRGTPNFEIDRRNTNRYRVVVREKMGETSYCFSTPIYQIEGGKLVHPEWKKENQVLQFQGSNTQVSVEDCICTLQNRDGGVRLFFQTPLCAENKKQEKIRVEPTLNGVKMTVRGNSVQFTVKIERNEYHIHANSDNFSIMKESFRPFMGISALYGLDENGTFKPMALSYTCKDSHVYEIELKASPSVSEFSFEINGYEMKLFQDTVVESAHPNTNHVYGAMMFLGRTEELGESWLYSRPDFSKISELYSKYIDRVLLHIPVYGDENGELSVFVPNTRFCSYGSTWNKRVDAKGKFCKIQYGTRYISLDLTELFSSKTFELRHNEGILIKNSQKVVTLSTADQYNMPQILEIRCK